MDVRFRTFQVYGNIGLTILLRQMRILLDENFPADFATLLVVHNTSNVQSYDRPAIDNGELPRRAHSVCLAARFLLGVANRFLSW
jgi:hypothetical protein